MKIGKILGTVIIASLFFISCDSRCWKCIENPTGNVLFETCDEIEAIDFEERSFASGIIVNCAEE